MRIKKNWLDIVLEVLCLLLLLGTTIYIIAIWSSVPEQIPSHYNMTGEIDGWSSKGEMLYLVGLMYFVYILFTVIEQFPQSWNTGVKVTPMNAGRVSVSIGAFWRIGRRCDFLADKIDSSEVRTWARLWNRSRIFFLLHNPYITISVQ